MKKNMYLLLVFFLLIGFSACTLPAGDFGFSFSTANLSDPIMASDMENGMPVDAVTGYPQDAPALIAVCILNNAPDDTKIKFVWNYLTSPQVIYEVEMDSEGKSGVYIYSTLTSDELWPVGDYSVDMYIDTREEPDATVKFSVY